MVHFGQRTRRARLLGLLLVPVFLAAGCQDSSDDSPRGVLSVDDVPRATGETTTHRGFPGMNLCQTMSTALKQVVHAGYGNPDGPEKEWEGSSVEIEVKGGDQVSSSAWPNNGRSGMTTADVMAGLEKAIAECSAEGKNTSGSWSYTALEGLPDDQVGYRFVRSLETGDQVTERILTVVDGKVVAVDVFHKGEGEPSVSPADVLAKATERAKE